MGYSPAFLGTSMAINFGSFIVVFADVVLGLDMVVLVFEGFDHLDRSQEIARDGLDGITGQTIVGTNKGTRTFHVQTKSIGRIGQQAIVQIVQASDLIAGRLVLVHGDGDGLDLAQEIIDDMGTLDACLKDGILGLEQVSIDEDGHGVDVLDGHGGGGGWWRC